MAPKSRRLATSVVSVSSSSRPAGAGLTPTVCPKFVSAASAMLARAAPITRVVCSVDSRPNSSTAAAPSRNVSMSASTKLASSGAGSPSPAARSS